MSGGVAWAQPYVSAGAVSKILHRKRPRLEPGIVGALRVALGAARSRRALVCLIADAVPSDSAALSSAVFVISTHSRKLASLPDSEVDVKPNEFFQTLNYLLVIMAILNRPQDRTVWRLARIPCR